MTSHLFAIGTITNTGVHNIAIIIGTMIAIERRIATTTFITTTVIIINIIILALAAVAIPSRFDDYTTIAVAVILVTAIANNLTAMSNTIVLTIITLITFLFDYQDVTPQFHLMYICSSTDLLLLFLFTFCALSLFASSKFLLSGPFSWPPNRAG